MKVWKHFLIINPGIVLVNELCPLTKKDSIPRETRQYMIILTESKNRRNQFAGSR
jgi:hypothetical protein